MTVLRRNPNWPLEVDESPWRSRPIHLGSDAFWTDGDDATGSHCILLPLYDLKTYEVFDCLAWRPQKPESWWWSTGIATVLGEDDIRAAEIDPASTIKLVATPEEWLLTEPPCACVLNWNYDLRRLFGTVERIECASERLRKYLERQLDRQVKHKFRITTGRGR